MCTGYSILHALEKHTGLPYPDQPLKDFYKKHSSKGGLKFKDIQPLWNQENLYGMNIKLTQIYTRYGNNRDKKRIGNVLNTLQKGLVLLGLNILEGKPSFNRDNRILIAKNGRIRTFHAVFCVKAWRSLFRRLQGLEVQDSLDKFDYISTEAFPQIREAQVIEFTL